MGGEVKGVIFDYGGVISLPQNKDCIKMMLRLLNSDDPNLFEKVYYKYRHEYDLGIFDGTRYWRKVISQFGLEPSDGLIKKLHEQDVLSWTEINREILESIATLRNNQVKLAILSNMPPDVLEEIRQKFKWLNQFDACIFSCELGKVKPNPDIYRYSLDKLELRPNEAVFIDDTLKNITGAENVGLNTIWYQNFPEFKQSLNQFIKMIA
jgi:putative hydrolase of the HAD superfamily